MKKLFILTLSLIMIPTLVLATNAYHFPTVIATSFVGPLTGTATNATNLTVTDDTTTNATYFPIFAVGVNGNETIKSSSSKMTWTPSTGILSVNFLNTTTLTGDVIGNASTASSAAKWTTPRLLAGNSADGAGNVAFTNKFIVQGTTDTGLSGAQFLGALSTGLLKNTTTTGILSTAGSSDLPTITLTGPITGSASGGSIATIIASQTGTGSKFVMDSGPTIKDMLHLSPTVGTHSVSTDYNNTAGDFYVGLENDTGAAFGGHAYAATLYNGANSAMDFFTNATLAASIDTSQNFAVVGTVTASNLSGTNTGDVTIGAFGATPNANGLSTVGQAVNLQPADATNPGAVSTGTQTFAGAKTFSGNILGQALVRASSSTSGSDYLAFFARNTAAAANSGALIEVQTANGGGNPYAEYIQAGVQAWVTGMDVSDSNKFKISVGGALNSGTALAFDTSSNTITQKGFASPGYDTSSPAAGAVVTSSNNPPGLLLTPAALIATLTVKLPSAPIDGMQWFITSSQTVSAITLQDSGGVGGNVIGANASLTASTPMRFMYNASGTKWYRI